MFGYATDETEECMPLTVTLAHQLNQKISQLRRNGQLWWSRPDTKTQVRTYVRLRDDITHELPFEYEYKYPYIHVARADIILVRGSNSFSATRSCRL